MTDGCILVGRHQDIDIGMEIVRHEDIAFPASAKECKIIINRLMELAIATDVKCLVFQALPGQANKALFEFLMVDAHCPPYNEINVGQVVSKPGPRPASITKSWAMTSRFLANLIETALLFANKNVEIIRTDEEISTFINATVTPPMKFEFSHIEWLPKPVANISVRGGVADVEDATNVAVFITDYDNLEEMRVA